MTALRIVFGMLVPWLVGVGLLECLHARWRSTRRAGETAWVLGLGYLLGAFAVTLWMRVVSLAGVRFGMGSVVAPMLLLGLALGGLAWRLRGRASLARLRQALQEELAPPDQEGLTRVLWWGAIAWIALHFVLLAIEVDLRPLYPWDAWTHWATKARVWFELGRIVPFGPASAWFSAPGSVYFDASPYYPPTVPLLQVWMSVVLGQWNDALMNWPWWQLLLALVLVVYGGLRALGAHALAALAGAFFTATLPLLDTHVALAGYADLPMAAYYTAAGLAVAIWVHGRSRLDAAIAITLALACTQVKNPGLPWALTLLPAVIVALAPRHGMRIVGYLFVAGVVALVIAAKTNPVILHYRLHLDFDPAWTALGQSLFTFRNWHLLWYGAITAALLARRELLDRDLAPLTLVVGAGLFFLFIVFGFTNARAWVEDQTSINRATLHLAPLVIVFMVRAAEAFARTWSRRAAIALPPAAAAPAAPAESAPSA